MTNLIFLSKKYFKEIVFLNLVQSILPVNSVKHLSNLCYCVLLPCSSANPQCLSNLLLIFRMLAIT